MSQSMSEHPAPVSAKPGQAPAVGAVLLAGGLARRMNGEDKGLVLLAGQAMAAYALDTLLPLVSQCVINANRNTAAYEQLRPGRVPVIADSRAGHLGPLAGLSAALAYLDTDYVVMCPCDSPFIQAALLTDLISEGITHDADIAVAHDGERLQPVFCMVNRRVQASLDAFLDEGERKIDRWFQRHSVVEVDASKYTRSFRNINTEEERKSAEQEMLS